MAKIETLTLRVSDRNAQRKFYRDTLGMDDLGDGRIGYNHQETALQFVQADAPYNPQLNDLYWKIALSVPDIDLACAQLEEHGIECTEPTQFRDVGYLAKFTDPEGFTIELIDHWFKGERPMARHDETRLGGGAHLSLVTLRTADIAAVEPEIIACGMKPISVQPVDPYGFTLYFYAFTDETPPNPDLSAVENRTWVYRRPYTVLELQHVYAMAEERIALEGQGGFQELAISTSAPIPRLNINPINKPGSVSRSH